MKILRLNLKGEYFDQIKAGTKTEEYRLCKPFWEKRLEGRYYDELHILRGYPAKGNTSHCIIRPWRGFVIKTIIHPHFGPHPVKVYAINVGP